MYEEREEMPKGMKQIPEEYVEENSTNPVNHQEFNYSGIVREALENLKKEGLDIEILKMEMSEQKDSPTLLSIIMNVRETE